MRKITNLSVTKMFMLLVLFMLFFSCRSGDEKFISWYSPGPVEVFGNKHEAWIFLEFKRKVKLGGPACACDTPRVYSHGHFQEIIIVNKQGLKERIRMAKKDGKEGVTFNANISRIFEYNGKIYLYTMPSYYHRESLFEFNKHDKRFDLLSIEKGDTILNKMCPSCLWRDRLEKIYEIRRRGTFKHYYSDLWIGDDSFAWQGIQFEISTFDDKPYFKVKITINKTNKNYPIVLTYLQEVRTLTIEEYDNIKEESGHLNERGLESGLD
jgi:hypothetical protein